MSPIDIVDSEHTGVMKSSEGNKIRSQVLREYSLILASWVALRSACKPIYIVMTRSTGVGSHDVFKIM